LKKFKKMTDLKNSQSEYFLKSLQRTKNPMKNMNPAIFKK
jgi:hypothetical protein